MTSVGRCLAFGYSKTELAGCTCCVDSLRDYAANSRPASSSAFGWKCCSHARDGGADVAYKSHSFQVYHHNTWVKQISFIDDDDGHCQWSEHQNTEFIFDYRALFTLQNLDECEGQNAKDFLFPK